MARYTLHGEIATGGMATVHYGRLRGGAGFSRVVAIKRLRSDLASDRELVTMLVDEARLASRIQHANVVQTIDVITDDDQVLLVLEHVLGETLARILATLRQRGERVPVPIAVAIASGALRGLHAAHEAKDEHGEPLGLVHRDLSPQNVMVDASGMARVLDFGIAKARGRMHATQAGKGPKGKTRYMAPEQIHGKTSRRSDLFSMGVVLWEMLTGDRLFDGDSDGEVLAAVLGKRIPAPKASPELDAVVLRSLERVPEKRHASAMEMAQAIEDAAPPATPSEVGEWLESVAGPELARRRAEIAAVEAPSPAPRRSRAPLVIAGVAGVAFMAIAVGMVSPRRPEAASPDAAAPIAEPIASAEPPSPDDTPPLASASSSSSSPAPRPPRTKPAPRRDCDPPYTMKDGRKIWKRECF